MPVAEGACSTRFSAHCIGGASPGVSLWHCTKNTVNNISLHQRTHKTYLLQLNVSQFEDKVKDLQGGTTLVLSCALKSPDRVGHVGVVSILENTCFRQYITVEIRCQAFSNSWCPIWNFSTFEDFESSLADGVSFSSKYFGFFLLTRRLHNLLSANPHCML